MAPLTTRATSFRHEALLYSRPGEFLRSCLDFLRGGVDLGEPALVVVQAPKIDLLRSALGTDGGHVLFADMAEVGSNPGRIISAWRSFVAEHASDGRNVRGIGEPIWPERSAAELEECHRHESLLNLAFADGRPWWLLCPYDTSALDPSVIDEAHRNHPYVWDGTDHGANGAYVGPDRGALLEGELPPPTGYAPTIEVRNDRLGGVRRFIVDHARAWGLDDARTDDLVTAVNEVATNSVRHGGGAGSVQMWREDDGMVVCEVRDGGRMYEPLAGREEPSTGATNGRGLWMAHRLCDLVQLRSTDEGTTVRLHLHSG